MFWFTNANVAFVTDAPARFGAGTSNILLGEYAITLAGENAARWITASVDRPPFPATTEPLHIEVCTKMLVVRSSDAVVSDWQEVVEYGKNTLSVVKPSSEPIEFGAANRKITLSAWSVVILMCAFWVVATPTMLIVRSLKFGGENFKRVKFCV